MKIPVMVDIESQEVEVNVTSEDLRVIMSEPENEDNIHVLVYNINTVLVFLKGIPDQRISNLTPIHKKIMVRELRTELERWENSQ